DGRSPRLHALNRALRLCPACQLVHVEVARSLWKLNAHAQALVEWRTAAQLQPTSLYFGRLIDELHRAGATARELAAVASFDASKMVEVANFLSTHNLVPQAIEVLDQADAMGVPPRESVLIRARLQLQSNQLSAAQTT